MAITVLLADDQRMVRERLAMVLAAEPDIRVVGQAGDGAEAVAAARRLHPDVVVMDIRMPGVDGSRPRAASPATARAAPRVLVLTTYEVDEYIFEALRAGASGFMLKDAPLERFADAARVVADGDALLAPSVTRRLLSEFVARPGAGAAPDDAPAELTGREAEVLALVARGMSNSEIADHLVVGETTVKTHVSRILAKLALRDRVQAVVFAYEHGVVQAGS